MSVKKSLSIIFLTLLGLQAYPASQSQEQIDSLKGILKKDLPDTTRINNLLQLSKKFRSVTPAKAFEHANQGLALSRKINSTYWEGRSLNHLALCYKDTGNYKLALKHHRKAFSLFDSLEDKTQMASSLNGIGVINDLSGRLDSALFYYQKGLELRKELENPGNLAGLYNNIGVIYLRKNNYPLALDNFLKCLKINEEYGNKSRSAMIIGNIGAVYLLNKDDEQALTYFQKGMKMYKEIGQSNQLATIYNNISNIHLKNNHIDSALHYYHRARKIEIKQGKKRGIAHSNNNICSALLRIHDLSRDSLKEFCPPPCEDPKNFKKELLDSIDQITQQTLEIAEKIQSQGILPSSYAISGKVWMRRGNHYKAMEDFQQSLKYARKMGSLRKSSNAYKQLAITHGKLGNHEAAYENHVQYSRLKDSIYNEKKSKELGRLKTQYEYEKKLVQQRKEKEKQQALAKAKDERQNLIITAVSSGLGLVILFSIFLFNRFRFIRKQKGIIEEQKQEVDTAFEQLHEKNKEITDSIHYASRIQSAILTSETTLERALGDHFIYFNPKEAVSGDFYWAYRDNNCSFWVTADCTGHGVPGAFMSMIGNRLLNEVIVEQGERDPGKILDRIREGIIDALGQSGEEEQKDGMDAALCVLNHETMELKFAGGNNPLYVVKGANSEWGNGKWEKGNGKSGKRIANSEKGEEPPITNYRNLRKTSDPEENPNYRNPKETPEPEESPNFLEIKPDKQPIGQPEGPMKPFTTQTLQVQPGDILYTFSDGFADQFGGVKGKKYRYKPFKRLLLSLQDKSLTEQKDMLEKNFEDWRGNQEQVDDVVIIGVKME